MFKEVEKNLNMTRRQREYYNKNKSKEGGGKREKEEEKDKEEGRGGRMRAKDKANVVNCYCLENPGEEYCAVKNLALPKERNPFASGFLEIIYQIPEGSIFV